MKYVKGIGYVDNVAAVSDIIEPVRSSPRRQPAEAPSKVKGPIVPRERPLWWKKVQDGYLELMRNNGYAIEHSYPVHWASYQLHYGPIPKGYHIHHINHRKKDNDPDNLIAIPPLVHDFCHQGTSRKWYYNREQLEKFVEEYYAEAGEAHISKKVEEILLALPTLSVAQLKYVNKYTEQNIVKKTKFRPKTLLSKKKKKKKRKKKRKNRTKCA